MISRWRWALTWRFGSGVVRVSLSVVFVALTIWMVLSRSGALRGEVGKAQAGALGGLAAGESQEDRKSEQQLEMEHKLERERKKKEYENTKKLAEDLSKASQDLKETIDKAGENTLPLGAIRKCEEIESMAKRLKSKLKGG
jgi:hypothetical protein